MSKVKPCMLFAGPTLARAQAMAPLELAGITVLPPVQRGDIGRIRTHHPDAALVVVDGLFHQCLSVGHAELRDALDAGAAVWGLSSMGAIRAAELQPQGMRGYGQVFARYRDDGDFRDDEVTLLHGPEPLFVEISEPLIHLRHALRDLTVRNVLPAGAEDAIVEDLAGRWFGERTLPLLVEQIVAHVQPTGVALDVRTWVRSFDQYRVKALDLIDFVRERPWDSPQAPDTT